MVQPKTTEEYYAYTDNGGRRRIKYNRPYTCRSYKVVYCKECSDLFIQLPKRGRPSEKCYSCK